MLATFFIARNQILGSLINNAANMTYIIQLINKENIKELEDTESADDKKYSFEIIREDVIKIYYRRCAEHLLQFGVCDWLQKSAPLKFETKI